MQATSFSRNQPNSQIFLVVLAIQPIIFLKNYMDISSPMFIFGCAVWILLLIWRLPKNLKETVSITNEGIKYKTNSKKESNWNLNWGEINGVLFRISINKGRHLIINSSSGPKTITLGLWEVDSPNQKKINLINIFDLSLHQPIPSEEPIYKLIEKFIPINDDKKLLEDIKYSQEAIQLGKKAGVISLISILFSITATISAYLNKIILIENGSLTIAIICTTSTLGVIAFLYMRREAKPLGIILVIPIFLATTYWMSWSVLSATPLIWGSKETTSFELTKKFVDHQTWADTNNPNLTIDIYADMTKIRYFTYHTTQSVSIIRGPIGIIGIKSQEMKKFLK